MWVLLMMLFISDCFFLFVSGMLNMLVVVKFLNWIRKVILLISVSVICLMFERDLFVMINSVFRKVGIINILFKCIRYLVIFVFGRMWNIIKYKLKLWRSFMNSIWKKRKRKWVDIKVIY